MLLMKVHLILKLKEQYAEKLSYKIYIIFYNQKYKAQIIKNGIFISRKQLSIISIWNQKKMKKKTDKSKEKSNNLGRPKGKSEKKKKKII